MGTEMDRSTARMNESEEMRTSLFSSSTERPVEETTMRFMLESERDDSRLRARASTTTSLPSFALTVMPPLTKLAFTNASLVSGGITVKANDGKEVGVGEIGRA